MRVEVIHHALSVRSSKPLVVRGGLARTFGGLAGFLVVTFLCGGIYILEDAFANPLEEGGAALISAAFIITLAAILLFYLIKPRKRPRTTSVDRAFDSAAAAVQPFFIPAAGAARQDNLRNNLAYQRFYVDHCRIRP
jgi:hypothetical protein